MEVVCRKPVVFRKFLIPLALACRLAKVRAKVRIQDIWIVRGLGRTDPGSIRTGQSVNYVSGIHLKRMVARGGPIREANRDRRTQ